MVQPHQIVADVLQVGGDVGGVEDRVALLLHIPAQIPQQSVPYGRVQVGGGFVQDQQPGPAAKGHQEGEDLLLPLGELLDLPVGQFKLRPQLLVERLVPLGIEGAYHLMHILHRQGGDVAGGLAHKAHLFPEGGIGGEIAAQYLDGSGSFGDHAQRRADQGGFA